MKHSEQCVNLPTRELIALATILGIPIPQSLQDYNSHLPAITQPTTGNTTLAAAITASQTTIAFTAAIPGLVAGDMIAVGTENMYVQAVLDNPTPTTATQTVQVVRGVNGTTAASAASAAAVTQPAITASMLARNLIQFALNARAQTQVGYAWAFATTPPNWNQKPMQIGGAAFITPQSTAPKAGDFVYPSDPASMVGVPNPSPPTNAGANPAGGSPKGAKAK